MRVLKQIEIAYNMVSQVINHELNDKDNRETVTKLLEVILRYKVDKIFCDETNNPPNIIDSNILIARIYWKNDGKVKYIDLTFGKEMKW